MMFINFLAGTSGSQRFGLIKRRAIKHLNLLVYCDGANRVSLGFPSGITNTNHGTAQGRAQGPHTGLHSIRE